MGTTTRGRRAALGLLCALGIALGGGTAHADGAPVRDYVSGVPDMPTLMPMLLLPVAAVLELLFFGSRRRSWQPGRVSVVAGGVGGLLIGLSMPLQDVWIYSLRVVDLPTVLATGAVAGVLGLLGGFAGWRFGGMLRPLAPASGNSAKENTDA